MASEGEYKADSTLNDTVVSPEYFYIIGFTNIPHIKYLFVFLSFVYIVTVVGNVFLLFVIFKVKALHTPKYMIVCNLALVDLCQSTTFIPKMLDSFLLDHRYVVYEACLSQAFFVMVFVNMQSWMLVAMAYDRLIAICFPLRYHSLVSMRYICVMLLACWVTLISMQAYAVHIISQLPFCRSAALQSLFCDYGVIMSLSCYLSPSMRTMAIVSITTFMVGPLAFIALTYICIASALIRIASAQERLKAMKTCTSHLILVGIFYTPMLFTAIALLIIPLKPNPKMINELVIIVPALFNPIIYTLKTEEILSSVRKWKTNVFQIMDKTGHIIRRRQTDMQKKTRPGTIIK